jgi:hypothetical protein
MLAGERRRENRNNYEKTAQDHEISTMSIVQQLDSFVNWRNGLMKRKIKIAHADWHPIQKPLRKLGLKTGSTKPPFRS